ncbi:MAG: DUF6950 family protein [Allosphingosinicella sp.]
MSSPINPLLRRRAAIEAMRARYGNQRFDWAEADCWRMVRFHLRQLGHRPPATPRYNTALGAKRALKAKGFDSMAEALDSLLPRIAPAAMLPGDIAAVEGTEGLDALVIGVGHKVFGWHEEAETPVFIIPRPGVLTAAWRALS